MHAPNRLQRQSSSVQDTGSRPTVLHADELLETATDLHIELLEEDPANDDTMELSSSDLQEEPPPRLAVVQNGLAARPSQASRVISTADFEELVRNNEGLTPDQTLMFYCRAGDALPPYARHAAELPRFASTKMAPSIRKPPAAHARPLSALPPGRLPSFSIPDRLDARRNAVSRQEPTVVARRIPDPKLPKFRLEER